MQRKISWPSVAYYITTLNKRAPCDLLTGFSEHMGSSCRTEPADHQPHMVPNWNQTTHILPRSNPSAKLKCQYQLNWTMSLQLFIFLGSKSSKRLLPGHLWFCTLKVHQSHQLYDVLHLQPGNMRISNVRKNKLNKKGINITEHNFKEKPKMVYYLKSPEGSRGDNNLQMSSKNRQVWPKCHFNIKRVNSKKEQTFRCPLSWKTHLLSSAKNCSFPLFSCLFIRKNRMSISLQIIERLALQTSL